jgi:hypothetical protein
MMLATPSASRAGALFPPLVLLERSRDNPPPPPPPRSASAPGSGGVEGAESAREYCVSTPTTEYMQPVGWNVVGGPVPPAIASSKPYAICVRTTVGSFRDYSRRSLLHCGISDATGAVYHFDEHGLHVSSEGWRGCVSVPLLSPAAPLAAGTVDAAVGDPDATTSAASSSSSSSTTELKGNSHNSRSALLTRDNGVRWNTMIRAYHERHARAGLRYHTTGYNCFNYVVGFFNTGDAGQPAFAPPLPGLSPQSSAPRVGGMITVAQVASQLIQPRVHTAELYLWLLRRVVADPTSGGGWALRSHSSSTGNGADAADVLRGRFLLFQSEEARTRDVPRPSVGFDSMLDGV